MPQVSVHLSPLTRFCEITIEAPYGMVARTRPSGVLRAWRRTSWLRTCEGVQRPLVSRTRLNGAGMQGGAIGVGSVGAGVAELAGSGVEDDGALLTVDSPASSVSMPADRPHIAAALGEQHVAPYHTTPAHRRHRRTAGTGGPHQGDDPAAPETRRSGRYRELDRRSSALARR